MYINLVLVFEDVSLSRVERQMVCICVVSFVVLKFCGVRVSNPALFTGRICAMRVYYIANYIANNGKSQEDEEVCSHEESNQA